MFHNFHILSLSSYPFLLFFNSLLFSSSLVLLFKFHIFNWVSVIILIFNLLLWFKDIYMEGLSGSHTFYVQDGFKLGMFFFIFSEFMFFFGIFWLFFDSSLVPLSELGESWSPFGLETVNPFSVPLLNSCILLSSGVAVTWSHFSMLGNKTSSFSLLVTILLSMYFLLIQYMEYFDTSFSMSDSIYGSIFFFSTGFHGFHVMFGGVFLLYNYIRMMNNHFCFTHHLSYEFSILYWHFVDVVWLFLFIFVYWWSY